MNRPGDTLLQRSEQNSEFRLLHRPRSGAGGPFG